MAKMVRVRWNDASFSHTSPSKRCPMVTVGYVVKKTKKRLVLAAEVTTINGSNEYRVYSVIPASLVKDIKRLKKKGN